MVTDEQEAKHQACIEVTVPDGPERRRQGKFQPFRRLFGRKRRRERERGFEEAELKPSHSTDDVCNGAVPGHKETNQNLRKSSPLGYRAFSHESVFVPEDSAEKRRPEDTMSQDNVSDKVRNLQRQIGHSIKFGQKHPSLRKSEGDEGSSDEEEVPRSPMRVLAQVETEPEDAESKEKPSSAAPDVTQHRPPLKSPRSKRPPPPGTIESINLDAVPQSVPRLDNTAAKHKLAVKPKNQRVSRKHRRFTQDLLEMDLSVALQEETDEQRLVEESGVCRDEHAGSHTRDDPEPPEQSKKQRLQEEELEYLELQRKLEQEEHRRREEEHRAEEMRLEEEGRLQEELLQKEEEERRMREEEEQKRREEEERKREQEEESRLQELEAERLCLEEKKRKREAEEERRNEEEAEKQRLWELEEKWRREEEERLCEEQRRQQEEEAEEEKREEEKKRREEEDRASEELSRTSDQEWKRKAEELRWREMEERQRPFTFKVTSGEKQILFQKVNLSPVTPVPGQQGDMTAESREGTTGGPDSPALSSSLYVPHTAILVTGAQLCGTAVNLDQIKDTACKSLLGLSEDKKAIDTPLLKGKTSPDRKFGKTKSLNEACFSADQSSAAVLAEWASIRSKIFKGAEEGKYQEYSDESHKQEQGRPTGEDKSQMPFSHASLRKTMSASAKFSITPARKKFSDSNRNSEVFEQDDRQGGKVDSPTDSAPSLPAQSQDASKAQNKGLKTVRISDSAEECMFAKDLPSFLVPSMSPGSPKFPRSELASLSQLETEILQKNDDGDQRDQSGDERPPPFGIKLRRTNYSLRFHSEQSTEKRKKRYSAGDSFDGVPVPLTSIDQVPDTSVFSEKTSPISPLQENAGVKQQTISMAELRTKTARVPLPSLCNESDKPISKPPLYQKPATSPKPSEGATPPPSPLPKPGRRTSGDQRTGGPELASGEVSSDHKEDHSESVQGQRNSQVDDEPKEKKSFFPSITIPWREKTDRKTELIRREKPSLQSRHSLDSSRAQEKEAGPLWITLALQKQKGFREQQQSREERRIQREAKLAEKQARERETVGVVSPTEGKGNGGSTLPKPHTPDENKRPESLFVRFERRENLKKASTLPSSVTVEIADSTPSPPAAKDMSKRFPPGDNSQVSTEPAWLALAKRKAKAWSDCPQIIK